LPEYLIQRKTKQEERQHRIEVLTEFAKEGDFGALVQLATMHADGAVQEVMDTLEQESIRKIKSEPRRTELNQVEKSEIERLCKLIKSNEPHLIDHGKTELQAFVDRKIQTEDVCPDVLRVEIARRLK